MESLVQIIEVSLMGLIPAEEQLSWEWHIDILHLLQQSNLTNNTLKKMARMLTCISSLVMSVMG